MTAGRRTVGGVHSSTLAVADDNGSRGKEALDGVCSLLSLGFLDQTDDDIDDDDSDDEDELGDFVQDGGDNSGREQDGDEDVGHLLPQLVEKAVALRWRHNVAAIGGNAAGCLRTGEPSPDVSAQLSASKRQTKGQRPYTGVRM